MLCVDRAVGSKPYITPRPANPTIADMLEKINQKAQRKNKLAGGGHTYLLPAFTR